MTPFSSGALLKVGVEKSEPRFQFIQNENSYIAEARMCIMPFFLSLNVQSFLPLLKRIFFSKGLRTTSSGGLQFQRID